MKKAFLIFAFVLAPLLVAQAQYVRLGAKGGGGFARLHGDHGSSDYTNSLGVYHIGGIVSYEFVSRIAVQAELLYAQKGFTYEDFKYMQTDIPSGDLRLHYIELPLLFKLQKGGLFAEAGPYMGYMLAASDDFRVVPADASPPSFYASDRLNRFDYGYTAGVGIMLESGFFMSFRHTGGFRSITEDLDQKNFGFRLSIGYLLAPPNPVEMMRR